MDLWPAIYCIDGATFFVTPIGAGEGTRTPNHLFTRQVRYRLRHASRMPDNAT